MVKIREKRPGYWTGRFSLNGKRVEKRLQGCTTREEAEAVAARMARMLESQRIDPADTSLRAIMRRWIQNEEGWVRDATTEDRWVSFRALEPILALDVSQLTQQVLKGYVRTRSRQGVLGSTAAKELSHVRTATHAWREEQPGRSLPHGLNFNSVLRVAKRDTRGESHPHWEPEEVALILDVAARKRPEMVPHLSFLFATGCRKGELLGLRWEDVSLSTSRLTFQAQPGNKGLKLHPLKNGRRTVALAPATCELLRSVRGRRVPIPEFVFTGRKGEQMSKSHFAGWWAMLRPQLILAGCRPLKLHATRHTYITLSLRAGIPPAALSSQCGVTEKVIWAHYAHAMPSAHASFDVLKNVRGQNGDKTGTDFGTETGAPLNSGFQNGFFAQPTHTPLSSTPASYL